jgi:hypothetical protein
MMILMGENANLFIGKIFIFADPKTRAQDMPETPPPIIKTSNIIIDCRSSFLQFFYSKIKRIKTAQNEVQCQWMLPCYLLETDD